LNWFPPKEFVFAPAAHSPYSAAALLLGGLSWDPVKNTFTPGRLFKAGVAGAEDGDLGFPQPGADVKKSVYAPIGPFGKWRVFINPDYNVGLKWDQVQAIVIDFHIFKEAFER
jgi:hypothetical protein